MSDLAKRILELDQKYPGDADAPMELPAKFWAELVDRARAEASPENADRLEPWCDGCRTYHEKEKHVYGYGHPAHTRRGQPRKPGSSAQVRASTHPKQASAAGNGGAR